jgi:hypothetical protein
MEQQVDDELAQMSYQNYEAMMHLDKYSDLLANVGDKMKKDSTHKDSTFEPTRRRLVVPWTLLLCFVFLAYSLPYENRSFLF